MASFLHLASDYAKSIGFTGPFSSSPSRWSRRRTSTTSTPRRTLGFLREFDLIDRSSSTSNATTRRSRPIPGSTISSRPRLRGGSEASTSTAEIPTWLGHRPVPDGPSRGHAGHAGDPEARAVSETGGLNFDAKVRRGSFDTVDLFHAHIGGMDTFARGLLVADALHSGRSLHEVLEDAIAGFERRRWGEKSSRGRRPFPSSRPGRSRSGRARARERKTGSAREPPQRLSLQPPVAAPLRHVVVEVADLHLVERLLAEADLARGIGIGGIPRAVIEPAGRGQDRCPPGPGAARRTGSDSCQLKSYRGTFRRTSRLWSG